MPFLPSLPERASLLDVFKQFPETSRPLIEFHEVLLRGPSPFTEGERELIAAYVSRLNRCRYCEGVHTATAQQLGVPREAVASAIEAGEAASVAEKMKPILRYAQRLTQNPSGVSKADADAVRAAGWNETALYHTVAVTALFNFMNRLVEGLGLELDPLYATAAAERLAARGYLPTSDMLGRR